MIEGMGTRLRVLIPIGLAAMLAACTSSGSGSTVSNSAVPDDLLAMSQQTGTVDAGDLRTVSELPPPPNTQGGLEQPISNADILEVSVFQVPDLSRAVQVDDLGRISLPLIGVMEAAGKTARVLEGEIEKAYGTNYLQSPEVSVFVKESAAKRVTVDGEVNKAGVYPLPPSSSLLDAIALAGGFKTIADPSKVYVFRQIGDQKLVANYSVSEIREGRRANPRLYGGDVVVVFASGARVALQNLKEVFGVAANASRLAVIP